MEKQTYIVKWYEEYGSISFIDDVEGVVHNHFDCPICGTVNSETDLYLDASEYPYEEFECRKCESKFKIVETQIYNENVTIELIQASPNGLGL